MRQSRGQHRAQRDLHACGDVGQVVERRGLAHVEALARFELERLNSVHGRTVVARDVAPLKRPSSTRVNGNRCAVSSTHSTNDGIQARPSAVPKLKSGRRPSNKRGTTLAIECASHNSTVPCTARRRSSSERSAAWYGRQYVSSLRSRSFASIPRPAGYSDSPRKVSVGHRLVVEMPIGVLQHVGGSGELRAHVGRQPSPDVRHRDQQRCVATVQVEDGFGHVHRTIFVGHDYCMTTCVSGCKFRAPVRRATDDASHGAARPVF
jgi:hypothetical protein